MTDPSTLFREEASELLAALEVSLLELENRPGDRDLVASVFRTLHTIKGSGAMFGFDAIAAFTHKVETVFDEVRSRNIEVTPELVGVALAAQDHIEKLLREPRTNPEALASSAADILDRLQRAIPHHDPRHPESDTPPVLEPVDRPIEEEGTWRIGFEPAADLMLTGANPLRLLDELCGLGDASLVSNVDRIPMLEDFDPEHCYTSWDVVLTTTAGENAIRDVFIFVEDRARITIDRIEEMSAAGAGAPECGRTSELRAEAAALEEQHLKTQQEKRRSVDAAATLRVPAAKLDRLVNIVGELVTVQARLSGYALSSADSEIASIAEEVERLTEMLRDSTMNIRMLPIGETFTRFKRLVRDLASELGKSVELATEGNETELDKSVIDQLADPLLHLVRNAMDHGIELPERRLAAGKPETGTIRLSATHAGAFVLIRVADDGGGLDRAAIRARAVQRGLLAAESAPTDNDLDALIFAAGFSTAAQVTGVSGRGVGMDVVQRSLDALRGTISVTSNPGRGTVVSLKIPLTLAIIDGLLVEAAGAYFVVPLANVSECIELTRNGNGDGSRGSLLTVRDTLVPYVVLRDHFALAGDHPPIEQVIVADTNDGKFGFVVDRVIGDHHTVIKKLGDLYRHVDEISGATILGNGKVALILDVGKLAAGMLRERRPRPQAGR